MDGGVDVLGRNFHSPHNEFIYLWGNSGIITLLCYIAFLGVIFHQAYTIPDVSIRGPIMGVATMLLVFEMFGHSIYANHFIGPLMSVLALYLYYGHQSGPKSPSKSTVLPSGGRHARGIPSLPPVRVPAGRNVK
jgi:hypothetical protein